VSRFPQILVQKIGRQRTIRVVARVYGERTREILACGHVLQPPPAVERKFRVCSLCEERLGRVRARIGPHAKPEQVDLIQLVHSRVSLRLSQAKVRIAKLEEEIRRLRALIPNRPVVGEAIAGRMVVELNSINVTWAPEKLLEQRLGNPRGIKYRTPRADWLRLCQSEYRA